MIKHKTGNYFLLFFGDFLRFCAHKKLLILGRPCLSLRDTAGLACYALRHTQAIIGNPVLCFILMPTATPNNLDTPQRRYGPLSRMLSGVTLLPDAPDADARFFDAEPAPGLFCGRWSVPQIAQKLADAGCIEHWRSDGYTKIWIEISNEQAANRHVLEVWTQMGEHSELLMQLVVWLDYIHIDRIGCTLPQFCVEHLRLQSPLGRSPARLPGQDFPSSGQLRRIFGLIKSWACALGASLITEIPEYFHTAFLFSAYFTFIDSEMESLFRAICRDLAVTRDNLSDISRAFEAGNITLVGTPWLWPTEMQCHALSHELAERLTVQPCASVGRFGIT